MSQLPTGTNTIGSVNLNAGSAIVGEVKVVDSAGTNIAVVKAASTPAAATDPALVVSVSPNSPLPTGTNSIGNIGTVTTVTGVTTVSAVTAITNALPAGANNIGTVKLLDTAGTNVGTIKAASTAVVAGDTAVAVGLHPSSPLPTGTNSIGNLNTVSTVAAVTAITNALPTGTNNIGLVSRPSYTRSDTYTTTGNGTSVNVTASPPRAYAIEVKGTGAGATTWDVRLEGSLDNVNFTQILQHTNTSLDGVTVFSGANLSPALYIRSRCAGLSLGSATNIVVTILGV